MAQILANLSRQTVIQIIRRLYYPDRIYSIKEQYGKINTIFQLFDGIKTCQSAQLWHCFGT